MSDSLLTAEEAARRLGITVTTLYDWLGRSKIGQLQIHGRQVAIEYFQTGAKGQGRIRIEVQEIERIRELMRVRSRTIPMRALPKLQPSWPGITVALGRP